MLKKFAIVALGLSVQLAVAAPASYTVDPTHTYTTFEADHFGGLSVWRGKIRATSGAIVMDRAAKSGTVDITMDMNTLDFDLDKMDTHAKSADMFDVARFATATYKGQIAKWNGDVPTEVAGTLTLHGVSKPVTLKIDSFLCKPFVATKKERCGADAVATISRDDFGVDYGKAFGFKMEVKLLISVEADVVTAP